MNEPITYINNGYLEWHPMWWHKKGLQETASGYGSKLNTGYKTKYNGRLYRVYCCIWSNIGSLYIISKGKRLYITQKEQQQ